MQNRHLVIAVLIAALVGCSRSEETAPRVVELSPEPAHGLVDPATAGTAVEMTESQVQEYLRLFPYQDTFNYAMRYTGGDPANLNTWVLGAAAVGTGRPGALAAALDVVCGTALAGCR